LAEFPLVEQTGIGIEHWQRLPNGNWEVATIRDLQRSISLPSLGCELPVSEIYRNLEAL